MRDTEVKLAKAQKWIDSPVPAIETAQLHLDATPAEARLYFQTMYELIYLAFLSDTTRVATFQLGRENGEGPHDLLSRAVGLDGAHGLTHAEAVKKSNQGDMDEKNPVFGVFLIHHTLCQPPRLTRFHLL